jgi:uncharacterized protein YpmB
METERVYYVIETLTKKDIERSVSVPVESGHSFFSKKVRYKFKEFRKIRKENQNKKLKGFQEAVYERI